jgi:hypothetical protein
VLIPVKDHDTNGDAYLMSPGEDLAWALQLEIELEHSLRRNRERVPQVRLDEQTEAVLRRHLCTIDLRAY